MTNELLDVNIFNKVEYLNKRKEPQKPTRMFLNFKLFEVEEFSKI